MTVIRTISITCLFSFFTTSSYGQVNVNTWDNFQDGSILNWTNGFNATDPVNIPNGGPLGAGDRYLLASSGTFGGGLRSIIYNRNQWVANYISAGVVKVEMDLQNFGSSALSMRYALRSGTGNQTTPGYVSTTPFILPADGQWHHAVFLLDAAHLSGINSPAALNTFLTSVAEARILHAVNPSLLGDASDTQFGIDNIATHAVPEPTTLALIGLATLGITGCVWRVRQQRRMVLEQVCDGE